MEQMERGDLSRRPPLKRRGAGVQASAGASAGWVLCSGCHGPITLPGKRAQRLNQGPQ